MVFESLFDLVVTNIYLFAGPSFYTLVFAYFLRQTIIPSEGTSQMHWEIWIAATPLLYFCWLVWLLACCAVEAQINAFCLAYRKPSRSSSKGSFRSWLMLNASLCVYLRARFLLSLPLVSILLPLPGYRQLVLLSYSRSTHLGHRSLILGNLFDPDLTYIGSESVIGSGSSVIAHSLTVESDGERILATSPVRIGSRTVIGSDSQIHLGVEIGDDTIIEPFSYVAPFTKIGANEVWGGNPARFIRIRNEKVHDLQSGISPEPDLPSLDEESEFKLLQIVASAMSQSVDSIQSGQTSLKTAAWDSLAKLEIAAGLEAQFGIALSSQSAFQLRSLNSLRTLILRHRSRTQAEAR